MPSGSTDARGCGPVGHGDKLLLAHQGNYGTWPEPCSWDESRRVYPGASVLHNKGCPFCKCNLRGCQLPARPPCAKSVDSVQVGALWQPGATCPARLANTSLVKRDSCCRVFTVWVPFQRPAPSRSKHGAETRGTSLSWEPAGVHQRTKHSRMRACECRVATMSAARTHM